LSLKAFPISCGSSNTFICCTFSRVLKTPTACLILFTLPKTQTNCYFINTSDHWWPCYVCSASCGACNECLRECERSGDNLSISVV
jgi:hypothetical protein